MKLVARGRTWQVHFTDHAGVRQRLSTGVKVNPNLDDRGKAMANLAAIDKMREHLMGTLPPEVRKQAGKARTLGYAMQRTLDEHWSKKKSRREYEYLVGAVVRDIGYWPMDSVSYGRLDQYGLELESQGLAAATRNRRMSAIHTALTKAHLRGELEAVPKFPHYQERNVKERYLSPEEETRLYAEMDKPTYPHDEVSLYLRHAIPFLLDTGLRAGELFLGPEQDLGDRIWLPHGTTKSGRARTVPLTTRAREHLTAMQALPIAEELRQQHAKDPGKGPHALGRRFRTACRHAGIEGVTLHTLRHTCASRLVQAGISLYVVKEWLGHSSITVTERYAHLAPKNLEAAARALEPGAATASAPAAVGTPSRPVATVH